MTSADHREARLRPTGREVGLLSFLLLATSMVVPVSIGLLAVGIATDLGLGDAALGLVVSAFWFSTAVGAPLAGRWVDRRGWRRGAWVGWVLAALALVALALWVDGVPRLLGVMVLAGAAYSFCSPTSNSAVVALVPQGRRATVLGFKQTAPPMLSMAAGLVLPLVAAWVGWRAAVLVGLVVPLVLAVALFRARAVPSPRGLSGNSGQQGPQHVREAPVSRGTQDVLRMRPIVVAAGLGTVSVATVTGFSVITLVGVGMSPPAAALVVSLGSLLSVAVRIATGRSLDRRPPGDLTPLVAVMGGAVVALFVAGVGVLGHAGSGVAGWSPWAWVALVGVAMALVAAWTWPAMLLIAVVRGSDRPAASSGVLQFGSGIGSAVGPTVFGLLSVAGGRGWAWVAMAGATVAAIGFVRTAVRDSR